MFAFLLRGILAIGLVAGTLPPGLQERAELGVLSGHVVSWGHARPVAGASLTLSGPAASVVTIADDKGSFRVSLAPGRYILRCVYPGFEDAIIENVEVRAGVTVRRDVVLYSRDLGRIRQRNRELIGADVERDDAARRRRLGHDP